MENQEKSLTVTERALTDTQFKKTHGDLARFVKTQLRETKSLPNNKISSGDYGVIPYTNKKSLLKPGAEKLLKLFGFSAHQELVKEVEDFEHNLVLYKYRCIVTHTATGTFIADAVRSCNNKEAKHRSKDVYDAANTIESIAQKRALVAATVQATMASEIFDADVSENDEVAPLESVTKDEDPKRSRVTMGLYGTAAQYGWNDKWIHAAIKKKWGYESLTQCSNQQIEEIKEMIMIKYVEVEDGESPKLKDSGPVEPEQSTSEPLPWEAEDKAVEGEVVEEKASEEMYCRGKKHHYANPKDGIEDTMVKTTFDNPWCSDECQEEFYPKKATAEERPWEKGFKKKNQSML